MVPPSRGPATAGKWECRECGSAGVGTANRRPSTCPECGAPAEALMLQAEDELEDEGLDDDGLGGEGLPDEGEDFHDDDADDDDDDLYDDEDLEVDEED
jgi:hypothetical protein